MTLTLDITEELAADLGPEAARMSREAPGLEARRQGLRTEAQPGRFLGLSRFDVDEFLKLHGVELDYTWEDWSRIAPHIASCSARKC